MSTETTGTITNAITSVYWEIVNGNTESKDFVVHKGTVTIDQLNRSGFFDVTLTNDNVYTGDKVFSVNIYKDSTKAMLLASSVLITAKDSSTDQTTISKMLWSGLELYGTSPKMDGYEAYLGDPRWLPNGV